MTLIKREGIKRDGGKYRLEDPSARDVNVRHVAEFLPRHGDDVLQIGPLRDVAFGEEDVGRAGDEGGSFGGEA